MWRYKQRHHPKIPSAFTKAWKCPFLNTNYLITINALLNLYKLGLERQYYVGNILDMSVTSLICR
jgi:hypothetical protein